MATMNADDKALLRLFECAASTGARCPFTEDLRKACRIANYNGSLARLVADGWLRIEVYGKNWRVVEILKGDVAGKRTQEPSFPNSGPYCVRTKAGTKYFTASRGNRHPRAFDRDRVQVS